MPNRKARDVVAALKRKGFVETTGDHRFFTYHQGAKKTSIFTKTSHNDQELHDGLISSMAKQCKLSKADFLLLADCPMDQATYEAKMVDAKILTAAPVAGPSTTTHPAKPPVGATGNGGQA